MTQDFAKTHLQANSAESRMSSPGIGKLQFQTSKRTEAVSQHCALVVLYKLHPVNHFGLIASPSTSYIMQTLKYLSICDKTAKCKNSKLAELEWTTLQSLLFLLIP